MPADALSNDRPAPQRQGSPIHKNSQRIGVHAGLASFPGAPTNSSKRGRTALYTFLVTLVTFLGFHRIFHVGSTRSVKGATPAAPNREGQLNRNLERIEADGEFKMYLDAVTSSSERGRTTLYVLLVALVTLFGFYRNNVSPDWLRHRGDALKLAYEYSDRKHPRLAELRHKAKKWNKVQHAIDYAKGYLGEPLKREPDRSMYPFAFSDVERDWLKERIANFGKLRIEATTIHLPFIGLTFDTNDVGILGGLILAALLYVLASSMRREAINLELATGRADNRDPQNLILLLMTQVLSPNGLPDKDRPTKNDSLSAKLALYTIYLLPILLISVIYYHDVKTRGVLGVLENPHWKQDLDWGWKAVCWFLILLLTWKCVRAQWDMDDAIENLQNLLADNELARLPKYTIAQSLSSKNAPFFDAGI